MRELPPFIHQSLMFPLKSGTACYFDCEQIFIFGVFFEEIPGCQFYLGSTFLKAKPQRLAHKNLLLILRAYAKQVPDTVIRTGNLPIYTMIRRE
jgi:hypothetical protein